MLCSLLSLMRPPEQLGLIVALVATKTWQATSCWATMMGSWPIEKRADGLSCTSPLVPA